MTRILAIVDSEPFPPRNGETIPAAAHLRALAERWEVDIACLGFRPRQPQLAPAGVTWLSLPAAAGVSRGARLLRGLRGLPGQVPADPVQLLAATLTRGYGAVYVPLLRLLPWARAAQRCDTKLPLVVNASDAPSEIARRQWLLAGTSGLSLPFRAGRLARSVCQRRAAAWEREALEAADLLLVQSEADREAFARSAPPFASKVAVARNGVDESLFLNQYHGWQSMRLLHTGPVDGERRHLLQWFVRRVYLPLKRRCGGATLDVVGRVEPRDRRRLQSHDGVVCHGFVDSLQSVMESAAVSVAPTMMGYGLINKVAESLAGGLPCTGLGAFAGLPQFVNRQHGIEVASSEEWVDVLGSLLGDPTRLRQLSADGRDYARSQLRWRPTDQLLQDRVAQLLDSPPAARAA